MYKTGDVGYKKSSEFAQSFFFDCIRSVSYTHLDEMELPVSTSDKLKVKLGSSFAEEGDIVVVPEEDGYINIAWFLYEFIALNIPMKHVHAPGKCNKGMVGKLSKHLRISADDEDDDDIAVELPEGDISEGPQEIDPRWNELKKILDNN